MERCSAAASLSTETGLKNPPGCFGHTANRDGPVGMVSLLCPLAAGRDLPSPRVPARSHPPEVVASPEVEHRRAVGRRPPDHAARGRRPFQSGDRRGGAEEEPRGMGGRDRDPRGHRGRVAGVGDDLDGLLPAIAPSTEHLPSAGGRSLAVTASDGRVRASRRHREGPPEGARLEVSAWGLLAGSPCEALCQFNIAFSIGLGRHRGTARAVRRSVVGHELADLHPLPLEV